MSTQTKINRKTILDIKKMKTQGEKIAMLTAYDFGMASILDESDIDILLVGFRRPTTTRSTPMIRLSPVVR